MQLYVVNIEECYDCETELRQRFFLDEDNARKAFAEERELAKKNLENISKGGEILNNDTATEEDKDLDCPVYLYQESDNYFEYWEDGRYCEEHTSITFGIEETED
mgnify:CR=1 FL=1